MLKKWFGAILLCLFIPTFLSAQEDVPGMEAWAKHAAKGEAHKYLKSYVGKYKVITRLWMAPDAEPMESEGETEFFMIMGDLFLQQKFSSNFMGMPMSGMGFTGYDNGKEKFVGIWMDSMSSSISPSEGGWIEKGKSFSLKGKAFDPMVGKETTYRIVSLMKDSDTIHFEMYSVLDDGGEIKTMEMVYTRM